MCVLSMFHTNEDLFFQHKHIHTVLVPEMRHMIFYGPKKSRELQKFKMSLQQNKCDTLPL